MEADVQGALERLLQPWLDGGGVRSAAVVSEEGAVLARAEASPGPRLSAELLTGALALGRAWGELVGGEAEEAVIAYEDGSVLFASLARHGAPGFASVFVLPPGTAGLPYLPSYSVAERPHPQPHDSPHDSPPHGLIHDLPQLLPNLAKAVCT